MSASPAQDPRPSSDQTLPPSPHLKPSPSRDSLSKIPPDVAAAGQAEEKPPGSPNESAILTGKKLAVVFVALSVSSLASVNHASDFAVVLHSLLSLLLIALDQTILGELALLAADDCILMKFTSATALPRIASVRVFFIFLRVRLTVVLYRTLTHSPSKVGLQPPSSSPKPFSFIFMVKSYVFSPPNGSSWRRSPSSRWVL
jgi:hypothetical protein